MSSKPFGKQDEHRRPTAPIVENGSGSPMLQERPRICLIDIDADAEKTLTSARFNCTAGSLGAPIELPNTEMGGKCICRLNPTIPPNLHEYDVVVIDTEDRRSVPYAASQHEPRRGRDASQLFLLCEFPQTVFDPRPLVGRSLSSTLDAIREKESIIVIFAARLETVSYHPVELTARGYKYHQSFECDNFSFLPSMPHRNNKIGRETTVVPGGNAEFRDFLWRYCREFVYSMTFSHPTRWQGGKYVKLQNFIPLVVNSADEIVSYAQTHGSSILFVFPQLEDKTPFLLELFQSHLPAVMPNLFPFSTQFAWLEGEEYRLPNEARLLAEKSLLEQEYAEKIAAKECEIEENHQRYQFLHDLLTETAGNLVKSVEHYFRWLGFDNVVNCDETYPGRNEEDLQVLLDGGLLVVEVKGIGGTSKDSECSQISKIKYRRTRERGSFDVFALYIVNHQRHLPPENRLNPPFTDQQIEDAEGDERGLLTTYDLFKLYFAIDSGFITREDARKTLLNYGLVKFRPSNSLPIGKPLEVHYSGTVGVFLLEDVPVLSGEDLLIYEDGRCRKAKVVSLRDQDSDIVEASEGEIGIKLSHRITKESELWKPKVVCG